MKARKVLITGATAIMFTRPSRRESHPRAATPAPAKQLRRLAAAAAVIGSLAWVGLAITASAASAQVLSSPGGGMLAAYVRQAPLNGEDLAPAPRPGSVPLSGALTVTRTGMAGWQTTLIAVGAAVAAAAARRHTNLIVTNR